MLNSSEGEKPIIGLVGDAYAKAITPYSSVSLSVQPRQAAPEDWEPAQKDYPWYVERWLHVVESRCILVLHVGEEWLKEFHFHGSGYVTPHRPCPVCTQTEFRGNGQFDISGNESAELVSKSGEGPACTCTCCHYWAAETSLRVSSQWNEIIRIHLREKCRCNHRSQPVAPSPERSLEAGLSHDCLSHKSSRAIRPELGPA